MILETYRECLRDVLDLAGLEALLRALARREISLVEVETPTASPFASSLLFDYVATYMYEGDAPNAERRAAALSLDRELLRELLGQEELRELIDAGALEALEADLAAPLAGAARDLARRAPRRAAHARRPDGRRRSASACSPSSTPTRCSPSWSRERRAVAVRVAREQRCIAAQDAGLYRDALGVDAAVGAARRVPRGRARRAARARRAPRPHARAVHDRRAAARATASTWRARCASSRRPARSCAASCGRLSHPLRAPGRARVVRPRRAAAPAPRLARRPAARDRAGRAPRARDVPALLAGDRPPRGGGRRASSGCARSSCRCRGSRCRRELWERAVLPRRIGAYSTSWLDQLCAAGEVVWVGAGLDRRAARGRVALYFRDDAAAIGPPAAAREARRRPAERRARADPRAPARRALLLRRPRSPSSTLPVEALQEALWDLVWAGEVTNDAWAPLRAPRLALARAAGGAARRAPLRAGGARVARLHARAGAGPLVARGAACSSRRPTRSRGGARSPSCCSSATGS